MATDPAYLASDVANNAQRRIDRLEKIAELLIRVATVALPGSAVSTLYAELKKIDAPDSPPVNLTATVRPDIF